MQFCNGDLATLIGELKAKPGKHIYCDGGAEIVKLLLERQLIDELIISIIPVLLGNGKRLFKEIEQGQKLKLLSSQAYASGLVQVRYGK